MQTTTEKHSSWLSRPLSSLLSLNWETALFALILIAAIVTRFYQLEPRVMSHDETSHTYFSWLLYKGQGYSHDPVTHGPFQFHIVALSYFLFGDSDTSARIPVVLFSIATVAFMWKYRRYVGRAGALITAVLFIISPYMLYYGRYVRNESFVAFWGVLTIWAMLRYFETGKSQYLLWLTGAMVMHYATKETSYIYAAQVLLFLGIYFVYRVLQRPWPNPEALNPFAISLIAALVTGGVGIGLILLDRKLAQPVAAAAAGQDLTSSGVPHAIIYGVFALAGLALLAAIIFLVSGHYEPKAYEPNRLLYFGGALVVIPLLIAAVVGYKLYIGNSPAAMELLSQAPVAPPVPGAAQPDGARLALSFAMLLIPAILLGAGLLFAGRYAMQLPSRIWPVGDGERSFDMLIVVGTLILPTLASFLINIAGTATDYTTMGMVKTAIVLIPLFMLAIGVGLGWNPRLWLANAALFYGIFVVLFTSIFTNGAGFFTGLVGGLGYWLDQQAVERGTQPWYYYILVQVPVYEYLPALGSVLAAVLAALGLRPKSQLSVISHQYSVSSDQYSDPQPSTFNFQSAPTLALMGFWAVTAVAAYSYAGEKMPWLTVHIALPLILLAGWALGVLVETTPWAALRERRGAAVMAVMLVFLLSLAGTLGSLLGANPPFQGKDLQQLMSTGTFITSLLAVFASGWGLFVLVKDWLWGQLARLVNITIFALLSVLTARAAFMASYINYDRATEYLVYAHCAPGIKEALKQIEEISRRTTDGLAIQVAYDNVTTYPYWWYLRNYTNQRYYEKNPTRDLRETPIILVGDENYGKIEPVVGQAYYKFQYIRIWWPDEDYKSLTWERIWNAIKDPQMRSAIFQIWLDRDYTQYAELTNKDMSLPNWQPSGSFRLYIRKDMAAQLWNYGTSPAAEAVVADPYEGKQIALPADKTIGAPGIEPGQLTTPRNLAVAADGSLYVADTGNHRIQHLAPDGTVIEVWGEFATTETGAAPGGTFNEPWGIAVAPDGSVYVADTWNHRIQKFTADGEFVTMWGHGISQDMNDPFGFYGPRAVAVDRGGRVYVTDTGNKRVVVFDSNGKFVTQFGDLGFAPGQFDEPVGLALDAEGLVYIADTWNQRVQVMQPNEAGGYDPLASWDIYGWFGNAVDNKPYMAVDQQGHVFITDPEGYRVIEFTAKGEPVRYWGDYGADASGMNLPIGIAIDPEGGVWVVDTGNNRILHFTLPKQ